MPTYSVDADWRLLAEQTTKEMDSVKFSMLVARLCRAFELEDEEKSRLRGNAANRPGFLVFNGTEKAAVRPIP